METARLYSGTEYKKTCPNCGAAIEGDKCKYCGTVFIDFACIDVENPFFLKIKKGEHIYIFKAKLSSAEIERRATPVYSDNSPFYCSPITTIDMQFNVITEVYG